MCIFGASTIDTVVDLLFQMLGPMLGLFLGWLWGRWQALQTWKNKDFRGSLLVSLNALDIYQGTTAEEPVAALKLRTLFERQLLEIMPHPHMRDAVFAATERTTVDDPLLRFSKDESWFVLNAILNQIAEKFAHGVISNEFGLPVTKRWFTFCVTYEKDGDMLQWKPRVLLFDREKFLAFPDAGEVKLESKHHLIRVSTLRKLKREYRENPHLFMDMELAL